MKTDTQIVMDRCETPSAKSSAAPPSTVKTILLHIQDDGTLDRRVQVGLSLARATSAHLNCLHVTPIEAYVAFDSFGGVFAMSDAMKALEYDDARIQAKVEEMLRGEDVSWDYTQVTGHVASQVIGYGALADLIVVSREPRRTDLVGSNISFFGELLQRSRTPMFIPAENGEQIDPTGVAVIAWDGSYEAANAVRASVGLLKMAAEVRVVRIDEEKDEAFPNTRILEYLSRHGIHAEIFVETAQAGLGDQEVIAASLMAHANAVSAAFLLMGGYSHSRMSEYIFGGVTRTMLGGSTVPIVIAR